MSSKLLIAGAIVAAIVLCLAIAVAVSLASNSPAGSSNPQACSVSGFVVNTMGSGIPGIGVTLHLMCSGNSGDREIYNMTTTTVGQPTPGMFAFDHVVLTPDVKYAYLSTSMDAGNRITVYGRTDNFTLRDNANITNKAIVLHMPPKDTNTTQGIS